MKLLLDTHILLLAAGVPEKLTESVRTILTSPENTLFFSAVSIWEIIIKLGLGRKDFKVDAYRFRKGLVAHGYTELPVTAEHALRVESLPPLHKDPFDRMLLAQARTEGLLLVTADAVVAQYEESVLAV
ncbi:MAG: type II toxin-antitoxin system VapC family toxin [Deltaproteobacteria bacterium]|nr:type II toxin-antitoxin system VapC family toxin [Deltaproteobacteria bacterium]MBW2015246.1 type II toxin-antitoxin system VapC family toxin [Deltaproteobacteria bacterium]MBW2129949.1 type II toxin-antitoxin system VapC family toxin [Deltaproteobacteria bacterium]MBW2302353.1 type II toxin-antitoxin system VapC family toxin [Deltaproteobacteria bacterium]